MQFERYRFSRSLGFFLKKGGGGWHSQADETDHYTHPHDVFMPVNAACKSLSSLLHASALFCPFHRHDYYTYC